MDIILLNEVKSLTDEIKKEYDEICVKSTKGQTEKEISLIYEVVKKNIEGLYNVKENILIIGNCEYEKCSQELKPLIQNLFRLAIHFMREQDYKVELTLQRMSNADREAYLSEQRFRTEVISLDKESYDEEHDHIISEKVNKYIYKLIDDTKKRYINSFGIFRSVQFANKIIEKEYFDSIKYIEIFMIMKEGIYENFDNYDILVSAIQNIAYELIQLNAALDQAVDMQKGLVECNEDYKKSSLNVCFVIMDGVNSTRTNTVEKIAANTMALNVEIAKNDKLKLLCKFKVYKQDEVHGYVLIDGDENEFLSLVDRVYETKMKVAFALRPYTEIDQHLSEIYNFVYNLPFSLHGEICSEARKNMEEKKYLILGGSKGSVQMLKFQENEQILKEFVKEKYLGSNGAPEQVKSFMEHNDCILKYVEYLSKSEQVSEPEYRRTVLAAILHDAAKFDVPLVKHGFEGAELAQKKLREMGFGSEDINAVSNAIARHMGPIPGFMIGEAQKWERETGEKIEFPRPKNIVDKLLYDADMLSLIDRQGISKMLYLRPIYQKEEDEKIAKEYGILIDEAMWLSILKVVGEVQDSLYTISAKSKAIELKLDAFKIFKEFKSKICS